MMRRVLVTGASGFLGSATVTTLADQGWEVTPLTRASGLSVDLCDLDSTVRVLTPWRWDAVVNLAGAAPKNDLGWEASRAIVTDHVSAMLHLVRAIPLDWNGRFVHASGAIVYGMPESLPVDESHPRRPLHPYALAKSLVEDVLFSSRLSDRWILRMGGLFAEERASGALFSFARAAAAGEDLRVTTSSPPVPWEILHRQDAVEAISRALASPARDPGALNVGYGEPIQIVDIANDFATRAGQGSRVHLVGPEPPTFWAAIDRAKDLLGWPPSTKDVRFDELIRFVSGGTR